MVPFQNIVESSVDKLVMFLIYYIEHMYILASTGYAANKIKLKVELSCDYFKDLAEVQPLRAVGDSAYCLQRFLQSQTLIHLYYWHWKHLQ